MYFYAADPHNAVWRSLLQACSRSSHCILLPIYFALLHAILRVCVAFRPILRQDSTKLPIFPPPSHSLFGEYSTAAVAADNVICSDIGRDVLLRGGNAVDAAVATVFCIGVMDTQSAGIGGGHFMTIYNATLKRCAAVDAREEAPAAATEDMFRDRWDEAKYGWRAVAVPGEVHGLWTAYSSFGSGKVTWRSLVQPTVNLLAEGYPTSHKLASSLAEKRSFILKEITMRPYFINPLTNDVYKAGEQIKTRSNLLRTMRFLANSNDPISDFYRGNLTRQMVDEFQRNGGLLTMSDFTRYRSKIRTNKDMIYTRLNGTIVCGPPPPSGAAIAQGIVNIMDGLPFNMSTFDGNVEFYHSFIEASKFAYAARSRMGDMEFIKNASQLAKNLTSLEWAQKIRSRITPHTHPDAYYSGDFYGSADDHGTSHISVVDKDGNAVSVTTTINLILGALITSESTGVLWNDEMDDFSLPGHPNYFGYPPSPSNFIRPGKRPMSSMSPIVAFNPQTNEVMAIGGAGGSTIISGVAGATIHIVKLGYNVKKAIDFPRLHNQLKPNITYQEIGWPKKYIDVLRMRGHTFYPLKSFTVLTSVHRTSNTSVYANSDFRKGTESEPAGY